MVCRHCIAAVERILRDMGVEDAEVSLGRISLSDAAGASIDLSRLDQQLKANDFERVSDRNSMLVEQVKQTIIRHVRIERDCPLNLSECLEKHLNVSYDTVSRIFSAMEGRTIEKYFIAQKIELVKELLSYNTMTVSEIADMAGYSSVSHLSRQFKEITGITPSQYLRQDPPPRLPLTQI